MWNCSSLRLSVWGQVIKPLQQKYTLCNGVTECEIFISRHRTNNLIYILLIRALGSAGAKYIHRNLPLHRDRRRAETKQNYFSIHAYCYWTRGCSLASQFHSSIAAFNAPHMKLIRVSTHKGGPGLPVLHTLSETGSIYSGGRGGSESLIPFGFWFTNCAGM